VAPPERANRSGTTSVLPPAPTVLSSRVRINREPVRRDVDEEKSGDDSDEEGEEGGDGDEGEGEGEGEGEDEDEGGNRDEDDEGGNRDEDMDEEKKATLVSVDGKIFIFMAINFNFNFLDSRYGSL
jgi:hypothetical protein